MSAYKTKLKKEKQKQNKTKTPLLEEKDITYLTRDSVSPELGFSEQGAFFPLWCAHPYAHKGQNFPEC